MLMFSTWRRKSWRWKPFKDDEKCFMFYLKNSFRFWVISMSFWISDHVGKWLDKKAKVNFKIYDKLDKPNTMNILPDISRRKGNQIIKYGQLIEHNIRIIFLEKSCTRYVGETSPRSFSRKSKLSISLEQ